MYVYSNTNSEKANTFPIESIITASDKLCCLVYLFRNWLNFFLSDDKKVEFTLIKLTSSKISPLIALWCSFKYWLATLTDCEIAVDIFLLNQPLRAVSKIKMEKKAMKSVGVSVITEKIINIFFCNSCPAFFNLIWSKIFKKFLKSF